METIVTGVFTIETNADEAMSELIKAGVSTDNLSYIGLNAEGEIVDEVVDEDSDEEGSVVAERAGEGALAGAGIGALAGLAIAAGVVTGLGPVVAAGPIAAALGITGAAATTVTGATAGAVIGGLVGVLSGLGVAREDAETYEERVRAGDMLVLVSVSDETEVEAIKGILTNHQAEEVRSYKAKKD